MRVFITFFLLIVINATIAASFFIDELQFIHNHRIAFIVISNSLMLLLIFSDDDKNNPSGRAERNSSLQN